MSAQILSDRGGGISSSAADQQGGAPAQNLQPQGARAHQQDALQHQISTHRGREGSSAGGARAPSLQPQGARALISRRRSSAESPATGGESAPQQEGGAKSKHLSAQICNHRGGRGAPEGEHDTLPRGGASNPGTYMSRVWGLQAPPRVGWYGPHAPPWGGGLQPISAQILHRMPLSVWSASAHYQ